MPNHPSLRTLIAEHPEWQKAENLPDNLNVPQIAVYTHRSCNVVTAALRDGSLLGTQRVRGGMWTAHIHDVQRWARGLPPAVREPRRFSRAG